MEKRKENKMEIREIHFDECKSKTDVLQKIFKEYSEISVQGIKKILEHHQAEPKYYMTYISIMAKKNLISRCGAEEFITASGRKRNSPKYRWIGVPPKPINNDGNNSPEFEIDNMLSSMRKQLVEEFAPLMKVKKELNDSRQELIEVLDENTRLKKELQMKEEVIAMFPRKIKEQCEKIVEEFAKYFGVTRKNIVEILNRNI